MKRCALITAVLLCITAFSYAATPDALWQDYQKRPGYVSTTPTKPAAAPTPHVTVEAQDGSVNEPTTPEKAKEKAEVQPADVEQANAQQEVPAETAAISEDSEAANVAADAEQANEATQAASAEATNEPEQAANTEAIDAPEQATNADATNEATQAANTEASNEPKQAAAGDASVFNEAPPTAQPAATAAAVVIGNKPVAPANKPKPKPKLNLVGKPPLPRQFMRTPQAGDFVTAASTSGGYSIALPSAFGPDPLASLPQAEGAMLVRTASDILMCAVTVLDAADVTSYNSTQALPQYANKKVYWQWQHDAALIWSCTLSAHNDYHGDKILLEAQAEQAGKTYQMLFVMPANRYTDLLPQAVYALNSFKLN